MDARKVSFLFVGFLLLVVVMGAVSAGVHTLEIYSEGSGNVSVSAPRISYASIFYRDKFNNATDHCKSFLAEGQESENFVLGGNLSGNVVNYVSGITGVKIVFNQEVNISNLYRVLRFEATPANSRNTNFISFSPSYSVEYFSGNRELRISFADGEIKNRWLKIIVNASEVFSENLGLEGDVEVPLNFPSGNGEEGGDVVFIIGSKVGDVDGNYYTLPNDAVRARVNVGGSPVGICNAYDVDKNGYVLPNDAILVRNSVSGIPLLKLNSGWSSSGIISLILRMGSFINLK